MDVVKVFAATLQAAGHEKGVTVNIKGTPEEPLFQASQIGELLGISNIRDTLRGFDDSELHVGITDMSRTATFLTEAGMMAYRYGFHTSGVMSARVYLTRAGYERIADRLLNEGLDEVAVSRVRAVLREELKFDPAATRYDEKVLKQVQSYKARKKVSAAALDSSVGA